MSQGKIYLYILLQIVLKLFQFRSEVVIIEFERLYFILQDLTDLSLFNQTFSLK